jgi:hypothetical protein
MIEAARTSETLVNFYQTTRCYNPGDSHLRTHRRENLKSYSVWSLLIIFRHLNHVFKFAFLIRVTINKFDTSLHADENGVTNSDLSCAVPLCSRTRQLSDWHLISLISLIALLYSLQTCLDLHSCIIIIHAAAVPKYHCSVNVIK